MNTPNIVTSSTRYDYFVKSNKELHSMLKHSGHVNVNLNYVLVRDLNSGRLAPLAVLVGTGDKDIDSVAMQLLEATSSDELHIMFNDCWNENTPHWRSMITEVILDRERNYKRYNKH